MGSSAADAFQGFAPNQERFSCWGGGGRVGGVSKVTNENISRHIQYIKLQSVSPLIGNKCKCLVMPGLGAMKNTSGWLVFLPTICSQNQRRECICACAHLRKATAGEEGVGAGAEEEDFRSGEGQCWRVISGQSFSLLMRTSRFCFSAQSFAPSCVIQPAEEGPDPTRAAAAVFLCALVGETKPGSPWRSLPGH